MGGCKDLKWLLNLKCRADLPTIFETYQLFKDNIVYVNYILPSHGEVMLEPSIILEINDYMKRIQDNKLEPSFFTKKYVEPDYYFDFRDFGPVFGTDMKEYFGHIPSSIFN